MLDETAKMACEEERTRLIGQIASLLRESSVPDEARSAGLTLIGWLARRLPGEPVSMAGVEEMLKRCAEHGLAATPSSMSEHGARRSKATNGSRNTNGASSSVGDPSEVKQNGADKRSASSRGNGRRAR
jgi:hypothetical protein